MLCRSLVAALSTKAKIPTNIYPRLSRTGFSLGRLHMGGTSAGGQSVNGGNHEGGT